MMDESADHQAVGITLVLPACAVAREGRRKHRDRRAFLRGPVSWPWLIAAANEGGAALMVALVIRFHQGIERGADKLELSLSQLAVGLATRSKARRGLERLEQAGLVHVHRPAGRKLGIEICEIGRPAAAS